MPIYAISESASRRISQFSSGGRPMLQPEVQILLPDVPLPPVPLLDHPLERSTDSADARVLHVPKLTCRPDAHKSTDHLGRERKRLVYMTWQLTKRLNRVAGARDGADEFGARRRRDIRIDALPPCRRHLHYQVVYLCM